MSRYHPKYIRVLVRSGKYAKYIVAEYRTGVPSKPDSVLGIPDRSPEVRGRVKAQHPDWLGSDESHSMTHPGGRVLGQVMPAGTSTASSPANKVKPQARLSILILSKTYPSMGLYLAHFN
jgi:hypothetical protein